MRRNIIHSWMNHAACRGMPSSIFFVEETAGNHSHDYDQARAICAVCPVKIQCLAYAMSNNEVEGFWGGTTPTERKKRRKEPCSDTTDHPETPVVVASDRSSRADRKRRADRERSA